MIKYLKSIFEKPDPSKLIEIQKSLIAIQGKLIDELDHDAETSRNLIAKQDEIIQTMGELIDNLQEQIAVLRVSK